MRAPTPRASCLVLPCIFVLLCLLPGCSGFDAAWREELERPAPEHPLLGCWEGTWVSHVNQHTGGLRAIVTPLEQADRYQIWFHATYHLGFLPVSFQYTLPVTVTGSEPLLHFTGEADLGRVAGGVFRYDGTCADGAFHSTYESGSDHGVFAMTRPAQEDAVEQVVEGPGSPP